MLIFFHFILFSRFYFRFCSLEVEELFARRTNSNWPLLREITVQVQWRGWGGEPRGVSLLIWPHLNRSFFNLRRTLTFDWPLSYMVTISLSFCSLSLNRSFYNLRRASIFDWPLSHLVTISLSLSLSLSLTLTLTLTLSHSLSLSLLVSVSPSRFISISATLNLGLSLWQLEQHSLLKEL